MIMPDDARTKAQLNAENALSVLAAGFIGLLNFLGIKDAELNNVLRAEAIAPTIIGILAGSAFILAAASVFIGKSPIPRKYVIAAAYGLVAVFALVLVVTPVPFSKFPTFSGVDPVIPFNIALGLVAVAAIVLMFITWRRSGDERPTPGKAVAVVLALALIAVAGVGAIRLAERSQIRSGYPQLSAEATSTKPNATIKATGTSDRIPAGGTLAMSVYGVPRSLDIEALCADVRPAQFQPPCADAPCIYLTDRGNSVCTPLGYEIAQPDDNGVANSVLDIMFPIVDFQRIEISGALCRPDRADSTEWAQSKTPTRLPNVSSCRADDGIAEDPPKLAHLNVGFPDP